MIRYLLESSICMAVFYLLYVLFLRNDTRFHINRIFLLASITLTLVAPLLTFSLGFSGAVAELQTITLAPVTVALNQEISQIPSISVLLFTIWGIGVVMGLILLAKDLSYLFQAVKKYPKIPQRGYQMVLTGGKLPVSSFFQYLFWDETAEFKPEEVENIQRHELAHIRQKHTWDLLFANLIKSFFWFHPVAYWWASALEEQHEYLADAAVLQHTQPEKYARLVTVTLFQQLQLNLSHTFNSSITKRRIQMMFKSKTVSSPWKYLAVASAVALTLLVVSCDDEQLTKTAQIEDVAKAPFKTDLDEVYEIVEDGAMPIGGYEALYEYVSEGIKYPEEARMKGIEGKVYVQFIVDQKGNVIEAKAIKGIGAGCDEEAVRVVSQSPIWKPGKMKDGQTVKQRIVLPINFKLD